MFKIMCIYIYIYIIIIMISLQLLGNILCMLKKTVILKKKVN